VHAHPNHGPQDISRLARTGPMAPCGRDDLGRGYVFRPMVADRLGGED
jgi:hypothetical protein